MTAPRFLRLIAVAAVLPVTSCGDAVGASSAPSPTSVLQQLPDSAVKALTERRVFFGHQSVGANLLDGVQELMASDPRLALRIVKTESPGREAGPGVFHAFVGDNRRPDAKNADFVRLIEDGFGENGDIALLKYCYLDVGPRTDVSALFAEYRRAVDSVRARYPRLTLVHVTQPLTVPEHVVEARVRGLLGRPTERALNVKREQFNALMRAEYAASGRVFDLARVESTRPDGSRVAYRVRGALVPALAPEYTDDGGHLNALGRRMAAEQLIAFLARLSPSS